MHRYQVFYWTAGDKAIAKEVLAGSKEQAIEMLVNDPDYPLAQLNTIVEITEEEEEK